MTFEELCNAHINFHESSLDSYEETAEETIERLMNERDEARKDAVAYGHKASEYEDICVADDRIIEKYRQIIANDKDTITQLTRDLDNTHEDAKISKQIVEIMHEKAQTRKHCDESAITILQMIRDCRVDPEQKKLMDIVLDVVMRQNNNDRVWLDEMLNDIKY